MDVRSKLKILAESAKYDASCASSGSFRKRPLRGIGNAEGMGICHSFTPDGRCVSLLKILLTNYCVFDCLYCVNRISSDVPRARFTVREIVSLTLEFYKRNYIEGLFLSSGIIQSPDYTMGELVQVAKSLRVEEKFGGYIHLKAIPGSSKELLHEAGLYADRLSANIELPTTDDIEKLAPAKAHDITEKTMGVIGEKVSEAEDAKKRGEKLLFAPAGQTTQLIVGATETSDGVILRKANELYQKQRLKRVYFSGYSPIPKASAWLPNDRAPLLREHRLYQADWLLRFYGFSVDEIAPGNVNLSLQYDPKLEWALRHREVFPIDVNKASRELLLRVPGLGVRSVEKILQARKFRRLRLEDLSRMKVPLKKVSSFLATDDKHPALNALDALMHPLAKEGSSQLSLFGEAAVALSGEL